MICDNENDYVGEYIYKTRHKGDTIFLSPRADTLFSIKEDANWFYRLYDKYLIIDNGTGPENREVKVYDLETAKKNCL